MDRDCSGVDGVSLPALNTPHHSSSVFSEFQSYSEHDIIKFVNGSATMFWALDPIPTQLLKQCLPALITDLTNIVNMYLTSGVFPDQYKVAMVTLILIKPGLDTIYMLW